MTWSTRKAWTTMAHGALCIVGVAACGEGATSVDAYGPVRAALTIEPTALPSYATALPAYYTPQVLQAEDRTPASNRLTDAGATLGRVLFFDRELSRTRSVSCASCHLPALGFGDSAQLSLGHEGVDRTSVHSMRLANARFNGSARYFWDRRAVSLELQTTQPIQDAVEMGFDAAHGGLAALIQRLDALPYYPPLFRLAFGSAQVSEERMQRALAQYVRSLVSVGSRWDAAFAPVFAANGGNLGAALQQPLPGFTAQENRGRQLFMAAPPGGMGCAGCHNPPSFSLSSTSLTNGLDAGQAQIFRSPSLKNVALSRHFMHDGRFGTLEAVVDFYDRGVQAGPLLDPRLALPGGVPRVHNLSTADRDAVVAFLRTLSDPSMLAQPRFGDPFRR